MYGTPTHAMNVYKDKTIIATIKDKTISDIKNFFEQEEKEEDYYKAEKVDKCYSDNFVI